MALINQNSIIGITSITSPSTSNVLTVHTNDTTERLRVSTSGLSFSGTNASLDTSGNISAVDGTFTGNVSIGGTLTYEDVTNIDSVGIITAQAGIHVTGGLLLSGSTTQSSSAAVQGFKAHGNTANESGVTSADTNAMAAGVGGEISFVGKTDGTGTPYNYLGHIRGIKENGTNTNTACALTFHTRPTLTAPQERLRITSAGNVGINETAPAAYLVVKQSGNTFTTASQTIALFQRSSTTGHSAKIAIVGGNAASSDINFGDTDNEDIGSVRYFHTDNSLRFVTNAAERLFITSTGRIQQKSNNEDIDMDATASGQLQLDGNGYSAGFALNAQGLNIYNNSANRGIIFGTNETERLRINSTGNLTPGADATQNLGSASKRWANIYSADLQLSNKGSVNDVDGTWGQYTIQEGEEDLFLINRRNGKKYKFMIQEVN